MTAIPPVSFTWTDGGGSSKTGQTLPIGGQLGATSVGVALATDTTLPLPAGAAADGTDATGVTQLSGGIGIRGWLSGIFSKLSGTLAISAAALPLPTNAAADGTDATGVTQLTGGVGIRGWLSGIYSKLSGTIAVSGTFWQATQPVSVASTLATSETYANLTVNAAGGAGAPISVPTSGATLLAAARIGRKEITLIFESAVQARIGGSNVTGTAYGALYGGVAQEAITISGGAAVYGFGVGGTATISVLEVY